MHVVETGLALLAQANLPLKFWEHACLTAAYLINRMPTPLLGMRSPYLMLYKEVPDYKSLKAFGCACFPHLRPYSAHKFNFHSQECIFLGYASNYKGFKCLASNGRIYISKDVVFNEARFPYPQLFPAVISSSASSPSPPPTIFPNGLMQHILPKPVPLTSASSINSSPITTIATDSTSISLQPDTSPISQTSPTISKPPSPKPVPHVINPQSTHAMTTRGKNGIVKPKQYPSVLLMELEPSSYKIALKDPKWVAAMEEEYNALIKNHTWDLTDLPQKRQPIGCKWVFRIKQNPDGTVNKYKARLVAKGFHQQHGFDFTETFSPVVKPVTVRTVLTIAISKGWSLTQLDVNNAFLNGILQEEVYMEQPPGIKTSAPGMVCRLKKAIYGLKQAPRAWFDRLHLALKGFGFVSSRCDPSLFTLITSTYTIYMLVYVDDIIVTGNSQSHIQQLIQKLHSQFALKQLGKLEYFLGIEVTQYSNGSLFLSQAKYLKDLLSKANMAESKGSPTPMISSLKLSKHGTYVFKEPSFYRSIVGAVQYATLTRPEISFAVNKPVNFCLIL